MPSPLQPADRLPVAAERVPDGSRFVRCRGTWFRVQRPEAGDFFRRLFACLDLGGTVPLVSRSPEVTHLRSEDFLRIFREVLDGADVDLDSPVVFEAIPASEAGSAATSEPS